MSPDRCCRTCGSMGPFHKSNKYRCAACVNAASRQWREANPEKKREAQRRWSKNNPEKVAQYRVRHLEAHNRFNRRWRETHRDYMREQKQRWRWANPEKVRAMYTRHPERTKARRQLNNAVRDGRLIRLSQCQWPGCECTKVEAHHHDYTKPFDVQWLCRPHHQLVDAQKQQQVARGI